MSAAAATAPQPWRVAGDPYRDSPWWRKGWALGALRGAIEAAAIADVKRLGLDVPPPDRDPQAWSLAISLCQLLGAVPMEARPGLIATLLDLAADRAQAPPGPDGTESRNRLAEFALRAAEAQFAGAAFLFARTTRVRAYRALPGGSTR